MCIYIHIYIYIYKPAGWILGCNVTNLHLESLKVNYLWQVDSTLNPQPSTLTPSPFNPQDSTLHPQYSTLNPQPSTTKAAALANFHCQKMVIVKGFRCWKWWVFVLKGRFFTKRATGEEFCRGTSLIRNSPPLLLPRSRPILERFAVHRADVDHKSRVCVQKWKSIRCRIPVNHPLDGPTGAFYGRDRWPAMVGLHRASRP